MAKQSTQHKLDRVRSPRVQITYDVEVGGAIELKELPFVMGVLGDFTGQPTEPLARVKDRKFVDVNPDNFDAVLESMKPHLAYSVENKLSEDPEAAKLKVDLNFKSMDDFSPDAVARQVKPLRELLELRDRLSDLRQHAGERQAGRVAARSRHRQGQTGPPEGRVGQGGVQ